MVFGPEATLRVILRPYGKGVTAMAASAARHWALRLRPGEDLKAAPTPSAGLSGVLMWDYEGPFKQPKLLSRPTSTSTSTSKPLELSYRDLDPTQGEPTRTNREYWGLLGAYQGLFGPIRPYWSM